MCHNCAFMQCLITEVATWRMRGITVDLYPLGVYVGDMDKQQNHQHHGMQPAETGHSAHTETMDHSDPAHHDHGGHGGHTGHEGHAGHSGHMGHAGHGDQVAQFRRLFWIMLVIAVPVVAFSPMFGNLVGYEVPETGILGALRWLSPILGTVMYVWGGKPFLTGGLDEIKGRSPGMMLLIALAITVAFISSWGSSLGLLDPQLDFWWELALLVVIMLAGHWMEMRSLAQTTSALDSLAALLPDEAEKIVDGETVSVAPDELVVGDIVLVRPGSSVPADGRIVDGSAHMD